MIKNPRTLGYGICVRHWLDRQFPGHVTGRPGRVQWPPRPPDLTPLDFYLRVHLKAMLYQVKLQSTGNLKERIRDAYAHITPDVVRRERRRRIRG